MPKNTPRQYAVALYQTLKDLPDNKLTSALQKFTALLAKDHKLKQANKIIDEFARYAKKQDGVVEIEITAARELDEKILKKIKNSFGEKVEATIRLDENVLGGVKIKMENKILDGSLKTQLNKLKQTLI
jgi:F-type H+-transporting ATPase subunit delta